MRIQNQRERFIDNYKKRNRKLKLIDKDKPISESKYQYDSDAMTLYWNAKETSSIPIFQYLAFYQTIEYFFPIYSNYDAKQKIQNIIKHPIFDADNDSDITKIINTIKVNPSNKSFGSERDQLKSTILNSLTVDDLKDFINSDEERLNFYNEHKGKKLCSQKITTKTNSDLIGDITERIYQLRCRIVHSKISESDIQILLPNSNEIKLLNHDIDLIEFIARKVLIKSSRPLYI